MTSTALTYKLNFKTSKLSASLGPILSSNPLWTEQKINEITTYDDSGSNTEIKNYFGGINEICMKHFLFKNLKGKKYTLKTIIVNKKNLDRDLENITDNYGWFLKTASKNTCGGKDVVCLLNNTKDRVRELIEKDERNERYVLQRMVKNPITYDGYKVDFRFYVNLSYIDGCICVHTYDRALMRMAVDEYDSKSEDRLVQLTNTAIAKEMIPLKDLSKKTAIIDSSTDTILLINEFRRIARDVILSLVHLFDAKGTGFCLLGFDFMVADDYKTYLLEVNKRPAIYGPTNLWRPLLHKDMEIEMIPNLYEITLGCLSQKYLNESSVGLWKHEFTYKPGDKSI